MRKREKETVFLNKNMYKSPGPDESRTVSGTDRYMPQEAGYYTDKCLKNTVSFHNGRLDGKKFSSTKIPRFKSNPYHICIIKYNGKMRNNLKSDSTFWESVYGKNSVFVTLCHAYNGVKPECRTFSRS